MNSAITAGMEWVGAALAAGTLCWGAVSPGSQLYGPTVRRMRGSTGIALTFDDGPNPSVTPRLLDLLDRYHASATFFLIGQRVRACPSLADEIAARGHALGNHTDSHPNLIWKSPAAIRRELRACSEAIHSAAGKAPLWMRPPYGFRGPQLHAAVRETGHCAVIMWNRMAWDWRNHGREPIIRHLRQVRDGDIVLLHDGDHLELHGNRASTVEALEYWLPRWRDAGLSFVTVQDGALAVSGE